MDTIRAIFVDGVFRPIQPVALPDPCEVEFEPRVVNGREPGSADLSAIYETLARRFRSGENDVAARHDEHQP